MGFTTKSWVSIWWLVHVTDIPTGYRSNNVRDLTDNEWVRFVIEEVIPINQGVLGDMLMTVATVWLTVGLMTKD